MKRRSISIILMAFVIIVIVGIIFYVEIPLLGCCSLGDQTADTNAWMLGCGVIISHDECNETDFSVAIQKTIPEYDYNKDGKSDTIFEACKRAMGYTTIEECYNGCCGEYRKSYTVISIPDLKHAHNGNFSIVGYVKEVYECPSCPPGAFCNFCANYIVLSENLVSGENIKIPADVVRNQFIRNEKYELFLRLSDYDYENSWLHGIDLIDFNEIN